MLVSTQTAQLANIYGEDGAVRALAATGYDAYDFSMFHIHENDHPLGGDDWRTHAEKVRTAAAESGIFCNQTHAPFPSYVVGKDDYNKNIYPYLIRALEVTAYLGGKCCIMHPVIMTGFGDAEEIPVNVELYSTLAPKARELGVKIAIENMWNWHKGDPTACPAPCSSVSSFIANMDALEAVDPEVFVACLDIGHAEMAGTRGSAVELIRALGPKRLRALHVHDNDKLHDDHKIPHWGKIKWEPIIAALREIGYEGEFTYEADATFYPYPREVYDTISLLMLQVARELLK